MKKLIPLLFAILFGHFTYSQIVVTNADVVGKGNIVVQSNDENPDGSIQPGEAGADMSWDFSALAGTSNDTMAFMDPAQTPFADEFPMANLAIDISDSGFLYVERNDDRMALVGLAVEIDTLGEFRADVDPAQSMVEFPLEYGNTYSGTSEMTFHLEYNQTGIDSIRIKQTMNINREADAWGEMSIPMGTYNVLRVHQTSTITDSVWVKSFLGWNFVYRFENNIDSYSWWSTDAGTGFVIATLSMDESGNVMNATYMKSEVSQGTNELNIDDALVKVYPNPAENNLYFEFDKTFDGRVQILDLTGRIIDSKQTDGLKTSFNLVGQTQGVYFYRVINNNSASSYTGKLIKR
ncbi:MAG: T9SS type A sorting domain-containing protein [Bacteroidales bacterium]|nr:T9SS type A sorting domain-containing protein [Bacteroidales bacterium]MCF8386674.1 T9SS type A sorting domain-containing protein [Bacteroidales bacterium]MCF8399474.1 T9SS type A sorting domain-containing protein [Bacteroidales bacterium]